MIPQMHVYIFNKAAVQVIWKEKIDMDMGAANCAFGDVQRPHLTPCIAFLMPKYTLIRGLSGFH